MSIEIRKVYKEHLPSIRFVGKMYTDKDRGDNGSFDIQWTNWHKNSWMEILKKLPQVENIENGVLGLMGIEFKDGVHQNFQYWIGMMLPEETIVPNGFSYVDIPEGNVAVCWVYGSEENGEIYTKAHELCMEKWKEKGWINKIRNDFRGKDKNWVWFFERYNDSRINQKDEKGNVILDYGIYINTD
jgi:predicted transcriptional regulator YdeE